METPGIIENRKESDDMKAEGWGPWNVRAANALIHLHTGLELRLGVREPDGREWWELRWKQVERLGPWVEDRMEDDSRHRSGKIRFKVGSTRFEMRYNALNGRLTVEIEPLDAASRTAEILPKLHWPWPNYQPGDTGVTATITAGGSTQILTQDAGEVAIPMTGVVAFEVALPTGAGVSLPAPTPIPVDTDTLEPNDELAEVLWRGVAWNTIWQPRVKRLMPPVSRDWCVDDGNFGDYIIAPWDTFFCSLLSATRDREMAYVAVRAALAEMTERGMLPNVGGGGGQTKDRSQPPVGSFCVWRLFELFGDKEFLAEVYPQLARWHRFWMTYRDGNGDGLLEWGSDPIPAPIAWWAPHTQQAAKWESGLDNSPMYEDIPFNETTNTLELADVGLTCLYASDTECLAKMADALGKPDEAKAYREEYEGLKQRINDLLWDEEAGIYCNRHWDGRLADRYSPTSWFPLFCGVATPERAERSIREHLLNPEEFWGEWVIPAISRKDPNFPVQKYWQGRVWGPFNFLVYTGLKRYGFDDIAEELAEKSQQLLMKEWREEGHIHENYNAITGDGDDVDPKDPEGSSDPIYHWGGLLGYIALDARGVLPVAE